MRLFCAPRLLARKQLPLRLYLSYATASAVESSLFPTIDAPFEFCRNNENCRDLQIPGGQEMSETFAFC